jgi:hypothetical protein
MARPPRFPVKLEFFTTEAQFAALEALESSSMLTKSDHLRQATNWYLQQLGALPRAAPINGHAVVRSPEPAQ